MHDCDRDCKRLTAHIRLDGKWTKIGYFGSECKQFQLVDWEKENEEREDNRLARKKQAEIRLLIKQVLHEGIGFAEKIYKVEQNHSKEFDITKNLFDIDIESFCPIDDQ